MASKPKKQTGGPSKYTYFSRYAVQSKKDPALWAKASGGSYTDRWTNKQVFAKLYARKADADNFAMAHNGETVEMLVIMKPKVLDNA